MESLAQTAPAPHPDPAPAPRGPTAETAALLRAYHEADARESRITIEGQAAAREAEADMKAAARELLRHLREDLRLPLDEDHTGVERGVVVGDQFLFRDSHREDDGRRKEYLGHHEVVGVYPGSPPADDGPKADALAVAAARLRKASRRFRKALRAERRVKGLERSRRHRERADVLGLAPPPALTLPPDVARAARRFGRLLDRCAAWDRRSERLCRAAKRLEADPTQAAAPSGRRRSWLRRGDAVWMAKSKVDQRGERVRQDLERAEKVFNRVCRRHELVGAAVDGRLYLTLDDGGLTADLAEGLEASHTTVLGRIAGLGPGPGPALKLSGAG